MGGPREWGGLVGWGWGHPPGDRVWRMVDGGWGVEAGEVAQSRHQNYRAIYQELLSVKDWELNKP